MSAPAPAWTDEMAPGELLARRLALGLSQTQLSEQLRVPRNTLSRWETGSLRIAHGHLLRLALHGLAADLGGTLRLAAVPAN